MDPRLAAHAEHFQKQVVWCEQLGSPFNAQLLAGLAGEIGKGGIVDQLLVGGDEPLSAKAVDAGHLRCAGALHAMALSGRDERLTALYPAANPDWDMRVVLPAALSALETHQPWVAEFLKSPPQTNETRRSIAFLPGFAALEGPLHLMEIGASAGLNQHWDAFSYDGGSWSRPGADGAPLISTDWQGPPPDLPERFEIASRRACDRAPLDVDNPEHRLRLKAYVWPDQTERLARLDAAISLARQRGVSVDTADAADWLERELAGPLPVGTTVIFHSIAWQYFDAETDARAQAAIAAAGARSDAGRRLAWLRFEHGHLFGGADKAHCVDLVTWPGGTHRILVRANPHGTVVTPV